MIPNKLYAKNEEKLPDGFEQIAEKYQNNLFLTFQTLTKMTFRAIQPDHFGSPLLGKLHVNIEKRLSNSF